MMNLKTDYKSIIKETSILTVAVAIIAAAVYFFLVPSHASVSSISGLGIVLSNFIPLPLSAITMILNVVLLIIGFFTCGREFGVKTVYTSVMLPLFLGVFERSFSDFGSMTNSQELDVLCYILVVSVGLHLSFCQQTGHLNDPVCQGRFSVINMGYNTEITNFTLIKICHFSTSDFFLYTQVLVTVELFLLLVPST